MPTKSTREMSVLERMRHSLSARTFRAVLALALILSLTAISFGFYLFRETVRQDYRDEAWHVAQSAASMTATENTKQVVKELLEVYDATDESIRANDNEEYLGAFDDSIDSRYKTVRRQLQDLASDNEVPYVYIGALDTKNNRLIYLVDSDPSASYLRPGSFEDLEQEEMDIYLYGAEPSSMQRLMGHDRKVPAYFAHTEEYGYLCVGADILYTVGDYQVFAFADLDMNQLAVAGKRFLFQYAVVLLLATVIFLIGIMVHMKRKVVKPINDLAEAALAYARAKQDPEGDDETAFFSDLDIHTGDEIEELAWTLKDMERDMRFYEKDLVRVTGEKERINTELDVASQIQEGVIPHIFPAFPERSDFDVYATMNTAKEVGGDFYDFFLVDDDHLALVMADVSGKGIPAALYMMVSKILIKNYAMEDGESPARILAAVNDRLCDNAGVDMFVTVWLGILDLATGKLVAANAGHEYPAIRRGGRFEVFKDKHGFVLGGMPGMRYGEYEVQLSPGDVIFQYTDGVTEATDKNNELFGMDRLMDALNQDPEADCNQVTENVYRAIAGFVKTADQFDDITMLCMRYLGSMDNGEDNMKAETAREMVVAAKKENLPQVSDFLEDYLMELGCPMGAVIQTSVAVEEIFVNIASYAYGEEGGDAKITLDVPEGKKGVVITFRDSGIPYDPLAKEDPDVTLSAEDRSVGGLGIYMVKQSMDELDYVYEDGMNVLTMKRFW